MKRLHQNSSLECSAQSLTPVFLRKGPSETRGAARRESRGPGPSVPVCPDACSRPGACRLHTSPSPVPRLAHPRVPRVPRVPRAGALRAHPDAEGPSPPPPLPCPRSAPLRSAALLIAAEATGPRAARPPRPGTLGTVVRRVSPRRGHAESRGAARPAPRDVCARGAGARPGAPAPPPPEGREQLRPRVGVARPLPPLPLPRCPASRSRTPPGRLSVLIVLLSRAPQQQVFRGSGLRTSGSCRRRCCASGAPARPRARSW